jgi:DNA-binding beta-propeller fold protein YncE
MIPISTFGPVSRRFVVSVVALCLAVSLAGPPSESQGAEPRRLLYVAEPGIRNYLEYGGHGLLVYDIDHGHKLLKRIKTAGIDPKTGKPDNVKGVCASARTGRIYVGTTQTVTCVDLLTEQVLWERAYDGGCDRMAIAPDGSNFYLPSFEKEHWNVVDGADGRVIARIDVPGAGAHNTVYGSDGKHAYLAGLRYRMLTVADTATHRVEKSVGPFSAPIRPFTVNGRQTYCFVNVNGLLGFEVGDIAAGKMLHRVEVSGYKTGLVKRHGCPSHGIGLTPDEKEIWVVDAFNKRLHLFDATVMPPKPLQSIALRDEPGWITFTIDGRYAYPSTGEVIETATRTIVELLKDETGAPIQSEKMVEIDFDGDKPVRTGDQFGVGRVTSAR